MKKVEQFKNKNQFRIYGEGENNLQSYDSLVVNIKLDNYNKQIITLGRDWDYSNTTRKHVYLFLEEYTNINFFGVNNKRKFVDYLIDNKTIKYDEEMY